MIRIVISGLLFLFASSMALGQGIRDVWAEVSEGKVLVHYVIEGGSFTDRYNISLYVSRDGGTTFEGPMQQVTGDAGKDVNRGSCVIIWDALKEMPFTEESLVFDVRGEKHPASHPFFIGYIANPITWMGIRAGILGKIGVYAELRGNLDAFRKSDLTCNEGIITDYSADGYYTFNGTNGWSAFSAVGGVTWQVIPNLYLYGGLGYGKQNYLVQVDQYTYSASEPFGKLYAKYDGYCVSGMEADAGAMYRIKWFLVSAGLTTIKFKSVYWTAGVGVTF